MSLTRRFTHDDPQQSDFFDEEARRAARAECDQCGAVIEGHPASRGLFLWTRGEEVRYEEPPLCDRCAPPIPFGLGIDEDFGEE